MVAQGRRFESRMTFFFLCHFDFFFFRWRHVFCYQCKNTYDDDWGVVWAIEKSVLYAYRLLLPPPLLLLCVAILLLLLQQQLLFVIVCRMPNFFAGSLNLIPVFSFSSFERDLFLMHPLAVLCRIYGLDLLRLVITGMRGANAGVSSPRRSPPCIINILYSKPSLLAAAQPAYTNISIGTCLY